MSTSQLAKKGSKSGNMPKCVVYAKGLRLTQFCLNRSFRSNEVFGGKITKYNFPLIAQCGFTRQQLSYIPNVNFA